MERLKAFFQEQFKQSPWAKPMLILLGILVAIYLLFPAKKTGKIKKGDAVKKTSPVVQAKRDKDNVNRKQQPNHLSKEANRSTPSQQQSTVAPKAPVLPKAESIQAPKPAKEIAGKEPTKQPAAQVGTLRSLVIASPSSGHTKADPFAPLVKKPQAIPVQHQTAARPKIQPPIKLPKIAVPIPLPEKGPEVTLKGIVWDSSPVAFLKIEDKDVALGVGGKRAGVVVLKIRRNRVWLKIANRVRVLGMEQ